MGSGGRQFSKNAASTKHVYGLGPTLGLSVCDSCNASVRKLLIPPAKATICWEAHCPGLRWFQSSLHGFQPQNGSSHPHLTNGCYKLAASSPPPLRETGRTHQALFAEESLHGGSYTIERSPWPPGQLPGQSSPGDSPCRQEPRLLQYRECLVALPAGSSEVHRRQG